MGLGDPSNRVDVYGDRYHRLLIGSVKHTVRIEKERAATRPELGLSRSIGDESPWPLFGSFQYSQFRKDHVVLRCGFSSDVDPNFDGPDSDTVGCAGVHDRRCFLIVAGKEPIAQ